MLFFVVQARHVDRRTDHVCSVRWQCRSEDLPADLKDAMGNIISAAFFNIAERGQQFRRFYLGDGAPADAGIDVALKTAQQVSGMVRHTGMFRLCAPFICDNFE